LPLWLFGLERRDDLLRRELLEKKQSRTGRRPLWVEETEKMKRRQSDEKKKTTHLYAAFTEKRAIAGIRG